MYCNKCGDPIEPNERFCNKCGNPLEVEPPNESYIPPKPNDNKKMILIGVIIGAVGCLLLFIAYALINTKNSYFFQIDKNKNKPEDVQTVDNKPKRGKYETAIITDNTYSGVKIKGSKDAYSLIEKDSTSQKDNCPKEIKKVEDEIISKYGITAVNLCEMDVGFAKELGNVFKVIYEEYPSVRGYITNLTLINGTMSDNYIAAFMPVFNFATSDSTSTYPWVIKTQVLLNTSYFLNPERLDSSVKEGSSSGHFPKNATIYSPVAHELGHYLSFLAMMNNYKLDSILLIDNDNINTFYDLYADFAKGDHSLSMIKEAYDNYKRDNNTTMTLDEWRGTISKYALAKNNRGEYIYDETVAESFHDVYLNKNNASDASKYVVAVLKKRLES